MTVPAGVRASAFADGRWYPKDAQRLAGDLARLLQPHGQPATAPSPVRALVAPHAGWFYSGAVAGAVYATVQVPDRVVILGPNHRGLGAAHAVAAHSAWRMPGRDVPVDREAAGAVLEAVDGLQSDDEAHVEEHSLELHVPFLVERNPAVRLVPICLSRLTAGAAQRMGRQLAAVIEGLPGDTLVVASSDMNHYEAAAIGNVKDRLAIDRMLEMDPAGLYRTVAEERITMCGVVPATVALEFALARGATQARLVSYQDSGDANGDKSHVVGYAGLTFA